VTGGIGTSPIRPDGIPKLTGRFAYSSDLRAEGMLWGATSRSPHPRARVVSIDPAPALAIGGVRAVLTLDDVPGLPYFGQEHQDQPVLTDGEIRFWGEAVAVVAADDYDTARRAARAVEVVYEPLAPLTDPEEAERRNEVFRRLHIRNGDPDLRGDVVVEGYYEVGQQDQAMLGTESGLAIPDGEGGVDLHVSTQWMHVDHRQITACLGLRPEQVRLHPAGIGGAFGAREDLTLQIHLCLLALHTGRPVKMVYDRAESFAGHVHRHPARMWYRHEADGATGRLVRLEAKILLDGGAYAETSSAVIANAAYFSTGPYRCPSVDVDAAVVRTNNPPAGAMRGFGANQVCFAAEAQMDRLAAELEVDPVEFRLRHALGHGDRLPTSDQEITGSLPTAEVIRSTAALPLPDPETGTDPRLRPGGTGLTTPASAVVRGVGFAVGIKNIAFSEAFDDYAEARAVLTEGGLEIHTAASEVGQGMVTILEQIARSATGVGAVRIVFASTAEIGSAGSTSASRQTQMAGGAVAAACRGVLEEALHRGNGDRLDDRGVWRDGELLAPTADLLAAGPIEHHVQYRHPPTEAPSPTGQGRVHAGFAVAAHRAVVDVDPELGLVRVVRIDTAQDVGRALNPVSLLGQIEGGIAQGMGLAVMEELVVDGGVVRNPSFTDYLLPTFVDAPDVEAVIIEEPEEWGPFGAKGMAELPAISSTAAVAAAIRNATGRPITRVPVRPEDIVGL
jgi:xanthine dehydrogenase D subunit